MAALMDAFHSQMATIRAKLDDNPQLQQAEERLNVPKEYLALGGGSALLIVVFFGLSAGLLCSIVGFLYPAFKSMYALEHQNRGEVTQWLIYWVVYSFFAIIEVFIDVLLYWIPFYYAFKVAFLLWAMLPQTRGAKFLYDSFLKDFLKSNESKIDSALNNAKASAEKVAAGAKEVTENLKKSVEEKKGD
jgi:receptor expression-enhancing protein 5/6